MDNGRIRKDEPALMVMLWTVGRSSAPLRGACLFCSEGIHPLAAVWRIRKDAPLLMVIALCDRQAVPPLRAGEGEAGRRPAKKLTKTHKITQKRIKSHKTYKIT